MKLIAVLSVFPLLLLGFTAAVGSEPLSQAGAVRLEVRKGDAIQPGFCEGAKLVSLDKVLSNPDDYFNKRIQTHAVLTTNVKEYTHISLDENSDFSVLTTVDNESESYTKRQRLPRPSFPSVVTDLFDKLRNLQGAKFTKDMLKLNYYRRDVLACGRLIGSARDFRFAVDDMYTEQSYLLPWQDLQNGKIKR